MPNVWWDNKRKLTNLIKYREELKLDKTSNQEKSNNLFQDYNIWNIIDIWSYKYTLVIIFIISIFILLILQVYRRYNDNIDCITSMHITLRTAIKRLSEIRTQRELHIKRNLLISSSFVVLKKTTLKINEAVKYFTDSIYAHRKNYVNLLQKSAYKHNEAYKDICLSKFRIASGFAESIENKLLLLVEKAKKTFLLSENTIFKELKRVEKSPSQDAMDTYSRVFDKFSIFKISLALATGLLSHHFVNSYSFLTDDLSISLFEFLIKCNTSARVNIEGEWDNSLHIAKDILAKEYIKEVKRDQLNLYPIEKPEKVFKFYKNIKLSPNRTVSIN